MVVSLLQRCGHKLTYYVSYFQDTVVALQALSEFAKLVYSKDVDMRINVFTTKGQTPSTKIERYINRENNDILQYVDVSVQYLDYLLNPLVITQITLICWGHMGIMFMVHIHYVGLPLVIHICPT